MTPSGKDGPSSVVEHDPTDWDSAIRVARYELGAAEPAGAVVVDPNYDGWSDSFDRWERPWLPQAQIKRVGDEYWVAWQRRSVLRVARLSLAFEFLGTWELPSSAGPLDSLSTKTRCSWRWRSGIEPYGTSAMTMKETPSVLNRVRLA